MSTIYRGRILGDKIVFDFSTLITTMQSEELISKFRSELEEKRRLLPSIEDHKEKNISKCEIVFLEDCISKIEQGMPLRQVSVPFGA